MKNGKTKAYWFSLTLGLILLLTLINSCRQEPESLIEQVSIKSIIADTRVYGDKVGDTEYIPPAPWRTRFKIALNGKKLDALQPDRNAGFDTTLFRFEGTLIDFRGSDLGEIVGFHFRPLPDDILEADFEIPKIIPSWNFKKDGVFMVVQVTTVTDSLMTQKAGFSLPLVLLSPPESAEGEKRITQAMYKEENSFEGKYDEGTGNTTNGPTTGTDLEE